MSTYSIPPQRVPFLDARGNITREWYLFLANVRNNTADSVVMIEDSGVSPLSTIESVVEQAVDITPFPTVQQPIQETLYDPNPSLESRISSLEQKIDSALFAPVNALRQYVVGSEYAEMTTPVGTVSATLEDVTGATLNIHSGCPCFIIVHIAFEAQTQSGASATEIGVAVNINGTDHDEMQRYLSGSNDKGLGAIIHREPVGSGLHVIKMRFRRVSGVATPGINKAHIVAITLPNR